MDETRPKGTQPTVNQQPPAPAKRRRSRRWLQIIPLLLIFIGGGLVLYPFIPAIRYALEKPAPKLPYQTRLTQTKDKSLAALPGLPVIGNKPIPADNRLVIPSIGIDMPILEGPDQRVLDRGGIWRIPNSSNPARGGNTVLSGHRWQYLPPSSMTLYLLDKVKDGEPVIVYWRGQEYDYVITGREIVNPDRVDILNPTAEPRLTIFTCTPVFSTKQRLVLYGQLIS